MSTEFLDDTQQQQIHNPKPARGKIDQSKLENGGMALLELVVFTKRKKCTLQCNIYTVRKE